MGITVPLGLGSWRRGELPHSATQAPSPALPGVTGGQKALVHPHTAQAARARSAHGAPRPRRAQEPQASWRRRSGPAYEQEEAHEGGAGCWEGLLAPPGACAASWLTVPHAGTWSSPSHSRVTETQPCHTCTHNITRGRSDQSRSSSSSSSTATTPLDKAAARDPSLFVCLPRGFFLIIDHIPYSL